MLSSFVFYAGTSLLFLALCSANSHLQSLCMGTGMRPFNLTILQDVLFNSNLLWLLFNLSKSPLNYVIVMQRETRIDIEGLTLQNIAL